MSFPRSGCMRRYVAKRDCRCRSPAVRLLSSKHLTHAMPFERQRPAGTRAEVPEVILLSEFAEGLPVSALFAGWWMASWGSPTGGFGIALSPLDARRVFDFATPALPDGWHSVRGEGTWVVVHD